MNYSFHLKSKMASIDVGIIALVGGIVAIAFIVSRFSN